MNSNWTVSSCKLRVRYSKSMKKYPSLVDTKTPCNVSRVFADLGRTFLGSTRMQGSGWGATSSTPIVGQSSTWTGEAHGSTSFSQTPPESAHGFEDLLMDAKNSFMDADFEHVGRCHVGTMPHRTRLGLFQGVCGESYAKVGLFATLDKFSGSRVFRVSCLVIGDWCLSYVVLDFVLAEDSSFIYL
jgi:hypothetical protein